MILLIAFAFVAGIVTILSPCILPILPIILSSTIAGQNTGKSRPIGVILGFVLSFTFFTLFLSTIVQVVGISADALRLFSIIVIAGFGTSLLLPEFQILLERVFSYLAGFMPQNQNRHGFGGGLAIGLSLGLLWTPCVGPILASVISLAITGTVTVTVFLITFSYSLGTAIPMFAIMLGGQTALRRVPWLLANTGNVQKAFGVLMIVTAIGIFLNIDRRFQTYILNTFPQYGVGLTKLEDNESVKKELEKVNQKPMDTTTIGKPMSDVTIPKGPLAPEIIPGGRWFNTEPLTLEKLRGKVVLIDFWTYSCINCQRTLPYLRGWHEKYKDKGLVIIGVHSPEFEFEKNEKNVAQALSDFSLAYPVVQDNDFATWRAYNNHYWPAKYLIDKDGYIRYSHFGEGEYDTTERMIQQLLAEKGESAKQATLQLPDETPRSSIQTPELYLGRMRIEYLASTDAPRGGIQEFSYETPIPENFFAFSGTWDVQDEYSEARKNAQLELHFYAAKVFLVITPKSKDDIVTVSLDGRDIPASFSGKDVKNGQIFLDTPRLYELINLRGQRGNHILQLDFITPGTKIYAFTFG